MSIDLVSEDARDTLAARLAETVAEELDSAIQQRDRASLAVSGGTSPGLFMTQLGRMPLAWSKVTVTLTDERWVPSDHPRSNHKLVTSTLLAGKAADARFLPLYRDCAPEAAVPALASDLQEEALPLDVCILGMGADMHTASLFPDAEGVAEALDPAFALPVMVMRPKSQDEPRMTLTASALVAARHIHLLIHGAEKKAALEMARATTDSASAPVKAILEGAPSITVWYAA